MHVTPSELRALRQDGTLIRFALLGSMAYIVADIPPSGSGGTPIEQPCTKPHWGFVLDGDVTLELDDTQHAIPAGSAFHIPPGGAAHRFRIAGAARMAGFEPIDEVVDTSVAALEARGFEVLPADAFESASVIPPVAGPLLDVRQIEARIWPMSSFVLTQARFGPGSGYLSDYCDAPHWGLVTAGRLAIEWEDDVEVIAAGDIYHCPGGPPGHRLEAADPAAVIDLTPVEALRSGNRLAPWRREASELASSPARGSIAVASLG
jgi:quercetin dioxygenase-like cupin family protein